MLEEKDSAEPASVSTGVEVKSYSPLNQR